MAYNYVASGAALPDYVRQVPDDGDAQEFVHICVVNGTHLEIYDKNRIVRKFQAEFYTRRDQKNFS